MGKSAMLSKALSRMPNRYLLVNLLTKRIRQLREGAKPLVSRGNDLSLEDIALTEIAEGKITTKSSVSE